MIKIIVVGLSDYRSEIKASVGKDVEIVAYSDVEDKYKEYEYFDYRPYVRLTEVRKVSYDYLVIAYSKSGDVSKAKDEFLSAGGMLSKVIEYAKYRTSLCINPLKAFEKTGIGFDVVLFGMSHSQCSIQTQLFENRIYKFASPSMDLFCQYKMLKVLLEEYPHKLVSVST